MDSFKKLVDVADRLLGPNGCSWDREQTLDTLKPYLLEETHELLEAIDLKDPVKIAEELGDVFYALVFIAKLNTSGPGLYESLEGVAEKLVRRHPHVFGDVKVTSNDDIVRNWDAIKKKEGKKNPIDGIPPGLPALARAQKVIGKLKKNPVLGQKQAEGIGQRLWDLVQEAVATGVDAESALRQACQAYEEAFKKEHRR